MSTKHIDIVFQQNGGVEGCVNTPPSFQFVEVEDDSGNSIRVGEWVELDDGYWALRITAFDYLEAT